MKQPMTKDNVLQERIKIEGCKDTNALSIPIYPEWVQYKGEVFVSQLNFERTKLANRPMFDLSDCMTKALHQNIVKTVAYSRSKFQVYKFNNE